MNKLLKIKNVIYMNFLNYFKLICYETFKINIFRNFFVIQEKIEKQ